MFRHGRGRHKQHMKFKLGLDRKGRIKAFTSVRSISTAALTPPSAWRPPTTPAAMMPTLYHIPNYDYKGYRVVTNKPACGAMRGPRRAAAAFRLRVPAEHDGRRAGHRPDRDPPPKRDEPEHAYRQRPGHRQLRVFRHARRGRGEERLGRALRKALAGPGHRRGLRRLRLRARAIASTAGRCSSRTRSRENRFRRSRSSRTPTRW